jgi:magnesium transporter
MEELYPADIASILLELDGEPAHYLITLVDTEMGAEILSHIETDDRKRFIKERFTVEEIAKYVNLFDSDDAVDLLNEQTIEVREKVIALIEDREQARFILDRLHYPEDVAGGLMQKELIKVKGRRHHHRNEGDENPDFRVSAQCHNRNRTARLHHLRKIPEPNSIFAP